MRKPLSVFAVHAVLGLYTLLALLEWAEAARSVRTTP